MMTILDFSWNYIYFMGAISILGVISNELFVFSVSEKRWKWATRKGDIMFSVFTAPVGTMFGAPYLWLWLDGKTYFGVEFSLGWYNAGTALLTGVLIIQIFSFIKKKASKKLEEVNNA